MKHYFLPQFAGVVKDNHPRAISENKCQDCLNVMFEEGHVKTRWGYRTISANLPLSGAITHIAEFEQIYQGIKHLLVCTTRDIYKWNLNRGIFEPLTEVVSGSAGDIEYDTSDGLVMTTTSEVFDQASMSYIGTYFLRFNVLGTLGHDNLVAIILDDETLSFDEDFVWVPFLAFNITPDEQEYSCIATYFNLVIGDPIGSIILYDDETEVYFESALDGYSVTFCGTDPISEAELIAILSCVREDGTLHVYTLFSATDPIKFVGTPIDGSNTINVSSYTEITVGSVIRISSYTRYGITATDYYMHYIVTGFNEETGVLEYESLNVDTPGSAGGIYSVCDNSDEGTVDIEFSIINQKIDIEIITGYMASVAVSSLVSSSMPFELRLCDSGYLDDMHDSAIVYDDALEDKVIAITNGVQPIRVWEGGEQVRNLGERFFDGEITSGSNIITDVDAGGPLRIGMFLDSEEAGIPSGAYITDIDLSAGTVTMNDDATVSPTGPITIRAFSLPSIAKYVDFFGSVGAEHVIIANTIDNNNGFQNPQTLEMSDAGEIDLWNSIFYDIIDNNDPIVGIKKLQTQLAIYKTHSVSLAWPNFSGGNDDPFEFTQNKISVGTPSIRTVIDFGDYHIFFGWDNIYAFNGIGVTPIGNDIMNDLNASINRPFMNRSFACSIPNKNLYILFVPCGRGDDRQLIENPNRAYVFNYMEKHWSIWQLAHPMTCFGTYHQSQAPTWADWLDLDSGDENAPVVKESCSTTNESTTVTVPNITGIQVMNVVEGDGIPDDTNVISVSGTTVILSQAATATGSSDLTFYKSWANMRMRWDDLILYEDNERYILGDEDGNIYELTDRFFVDDDEEISAYFITRDLALMGNPKDNFKLVETVIGVCDAVVSANHQFGISASIDFGVNWTDEIIVAIDDGSGYVEHIINWLERARQVRFKIRNIDGSYFKIESMNVGFNPSGVLKTNYN